MMKAIFFFVACLETCVRAFVIPSKPCTVPRQFSLKAAEPMNDEEEEEDVDIDTLRELFAEAVKDSPDKSLSSLGDLGDAEFKMLMRRRLGEQDYNKIFNHPRVEFEIK